MATSVILYVGETENRLDPSTQVFDATNVLAPNGGTFNFTGMAPGVVYNVWTRITGPQGDKILHLGKTRRPGDETPPVVNSATMVLSATRPASSIVLSWNVEDIDALQATVVQNTYIMLSVVADIPSAAVIKSTGTVVAAIGNRTFSGLLPLTRYYAWFLARDNSGNETAVTPFTPASLVTAADTTAPTVGATNLVRSTGSPETTLILTVTVADLV